MSDKRAKRHIKAKQYDSFQPPSFDNLRDKTNESYKRDLILACNYANYTFDVAFLAKTVREYFKTTHNTKIPASIPDWQYSKHGKVCWLLSNGVDITLETVNEMISAINNIIGTYNSKEKSNDNTVAKKRSIVDIKTDNIISEFEELVDIVMTNQKFTNIKPYDIISKYSGRIDYELINEHFKKQLKQLSNKNYSEFYENYSNDYKKKLKELFKLILNDVEKFKENVKQSKPARNPRKKRKVNPEKIISKLNYLKSFKELSLESIHPSKIVNAKILWTYNTKTKELNQYVSDVGFTVKGSTLCNINIEASCKKRLRKPKEVLKKLMSGGKVVQNNLLKELTTKPLTVNGRINKNTILLKIY